MLYDEKGISSSRKHTILNKYVPNNRTSKYIKQKLVELKRELN